MNRAAAAALGVASVLAYLWLVSRTFFPHLTDEHDFRQTQTALVARYLGSWRDLFANELPVLGPPWQLPFEFPLYQALARLLQAASGLTLESSGRLVAVAFMLLSAAMVARLAKALGARHPWLVAAPVLLAPTCFFWSRTFMIETTALFFALWFAAVQAEVLVQKSPHLPAPGRSSWRYPLALFVAGAAAALVKVTTFLPVFLVSFAAQCHALWRARAQQRPLGVLLAGLAAHLCAIGVGWLWVAHTDRIKLLNPLAQPLTSKALQAWNWGTLQQRLELRTWTRLAERTAEIFFPWRPMGSWDRTALAALALLLLVAAWVALCTPRRRAWVVAGVAMYVLPFVLFTNLHLIHTYYQTANAVFLCMAIGLAADGALSQASAPSRQAAVLGVFAAMLLMLAVVDHRLVGIYTHRPPHDAEVSRLVRESSSADSVLVVAGREWSSVLPYQTNRRALMLWGDAAALQDALQRLRQSGAAVEVYLACGDKPKHDVLFRQVFGLRDDAVPAATADGCRIYRLRVHKPVALVSER